MTQKVLGSIINYNDIDEKYLSNFFIPTGLNSAIDANKITVSLESNFNLDIDQLVEDLDNLITDYKVRTTKDAEAAIIVWKYFKNIPSYLMSSDGEMLWLALKCNSYICKRWYDQKKDRTTWDRYLIRGRGKNRHTISRLYWGAKLCKGNEKLIKDLFSNQDLSVAILERNWSMVPNFIKWYFEFMNKKVNSLNVKELDLSVNISTIHEFTKISHKRMIIKIFYALAASEFYDNWSWKIFENKLRVATEYALSIFTECKITYQEMCIAKKIPMMNISTLEGKIAKLNDKPLNIEYWCRSIDKRLI